MLLIGFMLRMVHISVGAGSRRVAVKVSVRPSRREAAEWIFSKLASQGEQLRFRLDGSLGGIGGPHATPHDAAQVSRAEALSGLAGAPRPLTTAVFGVNAEVLCNGEARKSFGDRLSAIPVQPLREAT
jgi:hypothetical protein